MARELPFFKFDISEWMLGRIQKQPAAIQGVFINLCCKYWHKLGELTVVDARLDFDNDPINALIEKGIIGTDGEYIFIKFLDAQLDECQELSKKNSINGLKSAKIRAERKRLSTTVEPSSTTPQRVSTEEKRREEKREKETSDAVFQFLQRKGSNTMEITYMVRQWFKEGHTDILAQLKAMKAVYEKQGLVFPSKIQTLTESFTRSDWIKDLADLDPERKAERVQKTINDAKHRPQLDTIGTSAPGSLG